MIKIYAHIPEKTDGTSWYRGAGPLMALAKQYRDEIQLVTFSATDKVDWHDVADVDLLFLQRSFSPRCGEILGMSRLFRGKAIGDWDDDFGSIHPSNPTISIYQNDQTRSIVKSLRQEVDTIWTTTEHLKAKLDADAGSAKSVVVPNAWPDMWFPEMSSPGTNNVVMWRGGGSHLGDLLEFAPQFGRFSGKFPLWSFIAAGDPAWPLQATLPQGKLSAMPWVPTPLFVQSMLNVQPGVVVVPLQDTTFNRSKSNIAWLEGIAAGAVVVCPDWDEWRLPGTFRYKDSSEFAEVLKEAVSTPRKKRAEMTMEGQAYIREHLSLSKVNELRMETIRTLAK